MGRAGCKSFFYVAFRKWPQSGVGIGGHSIGWVTSAAYTLFLMSALGQKRTLRNVRSMSALPPIADIRLHECDVRFVPKADSALQHKTDRRGHLAAALE